MHVPKSKAGLYTMEKVLYLASRDCGLNVYHDEKENTTLRGLVKKAISRGWITRVAQDDASEYFKCTRSGRIEHLRFKIEYAASKGKSTVELMKQYNAMNTDYVE